MTYIYRKINYTANLPLQFFSATVEHVDAANLHFLPTLSDTYLAHMLVKFETDCVVEIVQNFGLFDKKPDFSKPILTKR